MKFRLIIQINDETREERVTFTQDFDSPLEEFLVESEGWSEGYALDETIAVIGNDDALKHLEDRELTNVQITHLPISRRV